MPCIPLDRAPRVAGTGNETFRRWATYPTLKRRSVNTIPATTNPDGTCFRVAADDGLGLVERGPLFREPASRRQWPPNQSSPCSLVLSMWPDRRAARSVGAKRRALARWQRLVHDNSSEQYFVASRNRPAVGL